MQRILSIANVLGLMLFVFGLTYALPIATSLAYRDGTWIHFLDAMIINLALGTVLVLATRGRRAELGAPDGFLLVSVGWIAMAAVAAVPLMLALPGLSATDAFFEAMSGLTTTGATVLVNLDTLPAAINLWRHALQWFGGMGIILLAVAILPLLGVGGRQLYKAEVPGPNKDAKLTPRIAETAKALWLVYAAITLVCIVALRIAGMSWLDAVCHAFSAMSLGGFSTHDASVGFFDSIAIEAVLTVFMLVAAMNFATHYVALRRGAFKAYARDSEATTMLGLVLGSAGVIGAYLWFTGTYASFWTALRHATFNVVSIATDCGYASVDFDKWPLFAPLWMLFLSCVSCSSGSTGGGIKMFRTITLFRQAGREMARLVHPNSVAALRIGRTVIPNGVAYAVLAFLHIYTMTVLVLTLTLVASGLDFISALSAVIACINNMGPGLNKVGPATNYASLTDFQTWVLAAGMLLGRLELFTVIVLFTRGFWRR
ncbi:MAG: TrkH family potassium uptake protein [Burkholderiales bacterium]